MARPATDGAVQAVVHAINDLGLRLLGRLSDEAAEENVLLSPWSVALALAVVYNGAAGATARAMADTLGMAGLDLGDANRAFERLRRELSALGRQVELAEALSLWVDERHTLKRDYVLRVSAAYDAEVRNARFVDRRTVAAANAWVGERTGGRIPTLLGEGDLGPDAVLVMLSAVAFRGVWTVRFDPEQTGAGYWYPTTGARFPVAMMSQTGRYRYGRTDRVQAVSLPYADGRVRMYVLRPHDSVPLRTVRQELTARRWSEWTAQLREADGSIRIPRCTLRHDAELSGTLQALGMSAAFGSDADFRSIMDGAGQLSAVHHSTCVEVHEEGTEATAATSAVMIRSLRPAGFTLEIDRPFFFAIQDDQSRLLLFAGLVERPDG
jgi:serine protease inhibitor